jgi:hypothetical protein
MDGMASLRLTGSFPARVAIGSSTFEGAVTVVNDGAEPVEVLAATWPDVTVLGRGRVVMSSLARDDVGIALRLAPGASRELAAASGVPPVPGRYEIRAVVPIVGEDPAVGGPWILEVVGTR